MAQTQSLWLARNERPEYPAMENDLTVDVCVIGAGIAGLSVAYHLARAGQRVVVLDDGRMGSGETGRSTAHLTAALDDRYWNIENKHGAEGARLAAESHMAAINRAEEIVRLENIACDFQRVSGYLFAPDDRSADEHRARMERELAAAQRAGLSDVELLERVPLPSWNSGLALHFPRQAQFEPMAFLSGLARGIERQAGRIFENTHVQDIAAGLPVRVTTSSGCHVTARAVAVCTNSPISDFWITHIKQAPYRTFVVAARVPAGTMPPALYWDDANPYHYVRCARAEEREYEWLIVGGEDHKTGHADDAEERFHRLEEWTRRRFPEAAAFEYHWSGQVLEPFDYLSFTGPAPDGSENVYLHTGDSGNGITHGIMAGILLSDQILGRENPWSRLYDPKRISLKAAPEFVRENLDVAVQFRDYLRPGEVKDESEIPPGAGRLLRRSGKIIAAYRDLQGALHLRSAACTHLKCIVHWNSLENSWDCPCHGSRFDALGMVLNGPAVMPLEAVESHDGRKERDTAAVIDARGVGRRLDVTK